MRADLQALTTEHFGGYTCRNRCEQTHVALTKATPRHQALSLQEAGAGFYTLPKGAVNPCRWLVPHQLRAPTALLLSAQPLRATLPDALTHALRAAAGG